MLDSFLPLLRAYWPWILTVAGVAYLLSNYFHNGLNKYPGPVPARFSNWWRVWDVWGRRPDITHLALHRKHGDVVRLGPNTLSFANPKALKQIYGLNKGFVKVFIYPTWERTVLMSSDTLSRDFTLSSRLSLKGNDCHHCSPPLTSPTMPTCADRSTMRSP